MLRIHLLLFHAVNTPRQKLSPRQTLENQRAEQQGGHSRNHLTDGRTDGRTDELFTYLDFS